MRGERVKLLFHRIFDAMITLTYVVQWVVKELKQICDMKAGLSTSHLLNAYDTSEASCISQVRHTPDCRFSSDVDSAASCGADHRFKIDSHVYACLPTRKPSL
jgi:hypothetical protein